MHHQLSRRRFTTVVGGTAVAGLLPGTVASADRSGSTDAALAATPAAAGDWPQTGFDGGNSGYNPAGGAVRDGAEELYRESSYPTDVTPTVVDGVIYSQSTRWNDNGEQEHGVVALEERYDVDTDAWEFDERWSFWTTDQGVGVVDGTVYVNGEGSLYALESGSGDERWHDVPDEPVVGAPVVADGMIYVRTERGLQAYDADGTVEWALDLDLESRDGALAVADGDLLTDGFPDGLTHREAVGVDALSGDERWSREIGGEHNAPVIADGVGYLPGRAAYSTASVSAVDPATGEPTWTTEIDARDLTTPTVGQGYVFVDDSEGVLHALDVATGHEIHRWESDAAVETRPAVADGTLYRATRDDGYWYFQGHDVESGDRLWRVWAELRASPVVVGDTVYGPGQHLYAVVPAERAAQLTGSGGDGGGAGGSADGGGEGADGSGDDGDGDDGDGDDGGGGNGDRDNGDGGGDDSLPAFGIGGAVGAVATAGYLAKRRLAREDATR